MSSSSTLLSVALCHGGAWKMVDGHFDYQPSTAYRRHLRLPSGINFTQLIQLVSRKCGIDTQFLLSYKHPDFEHPFYIFDDDDVLSVIDIAQCSKGFTLFVVHRIHDAQFSTNNEYHNYFEDPVLPTEFDQINTGAFVNVPVTYDEHDPPSSQSRYSSAFPTELICSSNKPKSYIPENNPGDNNPFHNPAFDGTICSSDDEETIDEISESNEESKTLTFWGMPQPLADPGMFISSQSSSSQNSSSSICEGRTFDSKDELQVKLGIKCLEECFEYKPTTSNKIRFEARCTNKGCAWLIKAKNILTKEKPCFMITKLEDTHTCSRTHMYPSMRNANKKVVGSIVKNQLNDPSRVYRGGDIVKDVNERFKYNISYSQAWRGKAYALEQLQGGHAASFSNLPAYCHNLKLANPGTVTHILTDESSRFEMLFVAIGASVRSFSYFLRPVIIIDAAHLKGRYLGTNFLAVGMDANNHILPIAYGVGKIESGETWTWFLSKLRGCLLNQIVYTFVSDRAASIEVALKEVFPDSHHVLCCRHLQVNLNLRANKAKTIAWFYWRACKAYNVTQFNYWYDKLSTASPRVYSYLENVTKEKWTRAFFTGDRYNIMTSNSAESINSLSRNARKMPVVMLVEFFRSSVQKWYYNRRAEGENLQHHLTPWAEMKIKSRMKKSATWVVYGISEFTFQVLDHKGTQFIVDTGNRTCQCRRWQLSGLPCGHAISVARICKLTDCSHWAQCWFTKEYYQGTYHDTINPVPDQSKWEIPSNLQKLEPPLMNKRQAGRPKNVNRIPSRGERVTQNNCTRCGETSHTKDSCKMSFPSQESTATHPNTSAQNQTNPNAHPDDPTMLKYAWHS